MSERDRATGWQYAKLTGHTNEARAKELLDKYEEYRDSFMDRIDYGDETIKSTKIGGLHETKVEGILGKKTKSKTDMVITCDSKKDIPISIKKSLGGQVYLVGAEAFISVYEKQFIETIPSNVKRAIKLFWAAAADATDIIEKHGNKDEESNYDLQLNHKSLNATTLKAYDEALYNALLDWFVNNMYNITKLVFSMGAAKDSAEWSEFIWYINLLGEHDIDEVYNIEVICKAAVKIAKTETYYSSRNGGTTIQLPFGFVQWHQRKMQFHHSYDKIHSMMKP